MQVLVPERYVMNIEFLSKLGFMVSQDPKTEKWHKKAFGVIIKTDIEDFLEGGCFPIFLQIDAKIK